MTGDSRVPYSFTESALADVNRYVHYLNRASSYSMAEKFLVRLSNTAKKLSHMPQIGSRVDSSDPVRSQLRYFGVERHPKVQIVFRPLKKGGIEIVRVLHAARDIESLLERSDIDPPSE